MTVDGFAYVVTTNGTLHKVSVGANGALTQVGAVSFGDYSTSTPALADGVLYVGGSQNGQGLLAAIDAATLALTATVTAADGSPLPGEVKSTPLLVRDSAGVVALFTCNGAGGSWPDYTSGGGVFAYRLGDQEAQLVFDPPAGMHNYAMASVAYGGAGTFYYVNDSGHLFALGLSSQPPAPRPSTDSETPGEPQNPETPQKPESPTGPGKSNPKNPTSQNAGTTSLGTSANGKTPNGRRGKRRAAERRRCGPNPLRHHCAAGLLQHQGGGSWHRRRRRWGCPRQNRRSGSGQPHAAGEGERREH